jgi:hypothetical protein
MQMGGEVHMFVETMKKNLWLRKQFKAALPDCKPGKDYSVSNMNMTCDERDSMMRQVCICCEQTKSHAAVRACVCPHGVD